MKYIFLSFILILILSTSLLAQDCKNPNLTGQGQKLNENLKAQVEELKNILAGNTVKGYTPKGLFGHDFEIEKTDEKVQSLKKILNEQKGISLENSNLVECLIKVKKENLSNEIQENSVELVRLKISLLEKNKKLGDSLRESGITESILPNIKDEIGIDSNDAKSTKGQLESTLLEIQSRVNNEKDTRNRELLEYEASLIKIKINLLSSRININQSLENKIKQFEDLLQKLKQLSNEMDSTERQILLKNFKEVEKLWLSLSREKFYDLFQLQHSLDLPTIPSTLNSKDYDRDISKLLALHEEILLLKKTILKNYTDKKNQELKLLNHLITSSNSIRENYFENLGGFFFLESLFTFESYKMIKNEVVSAPSRALSYFYSKFLFIREQLSLGQEGYAKLFLELLIILSFLAFFFVLKYVYRKIHDGIDKSFQYLFRQYNRSYLLKNLFSLWNKLKDSAEPFFWLLALSLGQSYGLFDDVELLVKVAQVYLASVVLKSFLTLFLGSVSRLDSGNFSSFKIKANETSDKFKNIFQFYFFTMVFIEATIGKVYIYGLINTVVAIYSIFHFIKEASRWESEFRVYAEKKFSGAIVEKYFKLVDFCPQKTRSVFILLFILIFMVFDFFIGLTENFEISKKISANLFKKQIEKVEAEEGADDQIPSSYKENFSLKSLKEEFEYVTSTHGIEELISVEVNEWVNERSDEHTVVVYGDKGIGKTTLLRKVISNLKENDTIECIYYKMPAKTITKQNLHGFISNLFGDISHNQEFNIYNFDRKLKKKTVVVIDESQNIFLTHTGGFEAYYEMINIINMNTENIFWVMSFNKYSWLYLDRAFGRTQFFRNVFALSGWSDVKIKELIMRRHAKTEYKLSYDLLISATRSQDEIDKYASIESKFFKLLWELSRGNPRSALYLWMSALSRKNKNTFNVNIPREAELEGFNKMPDELMFVIAHVLKHENLSSNEIELSTNLQSGLVRNAIKQALEKSFFYKDARGRYMLDISTQYGLIRYLKLKNFIYGS